jgi:dienelactone hydrolase
VRPRLLPILLALVAAPALAVGLPGPAPGAAVPYAVLVDGESATGLLALPAHGNPTALLVACHGYGGAAEGYRGLLEQASARGFAALAMDYRGERAAWKVWAGWKDTVAATLDIQARFPSVERTVVFGFSMGGEVGGLAVAYAPPGTYDHWVSDAGVLNLTREHEHWPLFHPVIEAETGGKPQEVPQAYAARSPVALADRIAASGVQRAFLTHADRDWLVSADQSDEMALALVLAGQAMSHYGHGSEDHRSPGAVIALAKAAGEPDWALPAVWGRYQQGPYFARDGRDAFTPALGPTIP